jgi:hypothetical protein
MSEIKKQRVTTSFTTVLLYYRRPQMAADTRRHEEVDRNMIREGQDLQQALCYSCPPSVTDNRDQRTTSHCTQQSRLIKEFLPRLLWDATVHYRAHKSPPLYTTLSQTNPVHITPPLLNITLILSSLIHAGLSTKMCMR